MNIRFKLVVAPLLMAALLIASCTDDDGPVRPEEVETTPPVYIDEPLVVDTTVSVEYSHLGVDHAVFDVSNLPMFANGEYDDIHIEYTTLNVPDEEHLVFNFTWRGWSILVPERGDTGPIQPAIGFHGHMFSEMGLPLSDFLNDSLHIWLRPYFFSPFLTPSEIAGMMNQGHYRLRGIAYHPGYHSARVPIPLAAEIGGFAFDGESYWLISGRDKLVRFSTTGELCGQIPIEMVIPRSLAIADDRFFIGEILPAMTTSGLVRSINFNGDEVNYFRLSGIWPNAMTVVDSSIWVANGASENYDIYRVDPAASFETHSAAIEDTIPFEKRVIAITTDGDDLLVASDSLYVMTKQGVKLAAYDWTLNGPRGAAYDSGTLYVLGGAPTGFHSDNVQVVRLKLR